jgi:hypothetical protein
MRYVLFAGKNYYPAGGTRDLIGFYPTLLDAVKAYGKAEYKQWFNILDCQEQKEVELPRTRFGGIPLYNDLIDWASEEDLIRNKEK